jgi:hypothetical protein
MAARVFVLAVGKTARDRETTLSLLISPYHFTIISPQGMTQICYPAQHHNTR